MKKPKQMPTIPQADIRWLAKLAESIWRVEPSNIGGNIRKECRALTQAELDRVIATITTYGLPCRMDIGIVLDGARHFQIYKPKSGKLAQPLLTLTTFHLDISGKYSAACAQLRDARSQLQEHANTIFDPLVKSLENRRRLGAYNIEPSIG